MTKSISTLAISCAFSCLIISSCAINRTVPGKRLDETIVPQDFNPQKHIILIVKMPNDKKGKINAQMTEMLNKYYPAKFEIVESEDIGLNNPKYMDTSVYKYAVVNSLRGVERTTTTMVTTSHGTHSVSPSATTTYISYRFFDRITNKSYPQSYPSAWIKTSVEAFANTVKKARGL